MADTEADKELATNQSRVNADDGAGMGNHCQSSGERMVENCVGLKREKIDELKPLGMMAVLMLLN